MMPIPTTDDDIRASYRATLASTAAQEALLVDRIRALSLSEEQPREFAERLAATLVRAVRDVPAYRAVGLSGEDVEAFEDPLSALSRFPLVDKSDLRDRLADFCSDDIDPDECRFGTTSGTTGMPLKVIHSLDFIASEFAAGLRRNRESGLPGRRRILMPMKTVPLPWTEYESPAKGYSLIAEFGTGAYEDEDPAELLERVRKFAPDVVYGHPSDCMVLAQALGAADVGVSPTLVATFGEYMSATVREYLESAFATARVVDFYAMYEFGNIAVQCLHGAYHVEDKVYVEVVDSDGLPVVPGISGEIVVTGLNNDVMPLIRYRTGDLGAVSSPECPCGKRSQVITGLVGRGSGVVAFEDGAQVRLSGVTRILRRYPLLRFQIARESESGFTVRIQPSPDFEDEMLSGMRDLLARELADRSVAVRVVGPDEFLPDGRRKTVDYLDLRPAH
ncbi:phenylacetate--CoA ligase family protein [Streptomyces sp. NPDC090741]|uniref:phenylacetate--CoA ligase family protein n=1 Tax=Streptomyces sp. NPDC090741 TaxID=3365967 RepID=UPI00381FE089